jgi:hypothetical protein
MVQMGGWVLDVGPQGVNHKAGVGQRLRIPRALPAQAAYQKK